MSVVSFWLGVQDESPTLASRSPSFSHKYFEIILNMIIFKLPPLCKFRNLIETMNILSVLHTMIFQAVLRRQPR